MEPYDLEQIIREETEFIGLSGEDSARAPLDAAKQEIEQAIDEACAAHSCSLYDLPMESEYMFDPLYDSEQMLLILSWSMPEPF